MFDALFENVPPRGTMTERGTDWRSFAGGEDDSMMGRIGFIGTGNMGSVLAKAVCRSQGAQSLLLADHMPEKARQLAEELGCTVADNQGIAQDCDVIFLGVKPQMMAGMLAEIAPVLKKRGGGFLLASMAAALTCQQIREMAGGEYPVIRMMPNAPCAVGAGVVQYCTLGVAGSDCVAFESMMAPAGLVDPIPEQLMDAATAVSSCGPAFLALFVEALADGGVACGLPRDKAMRYAAQMARGSAELMLESGLHPGVLKDQVCSPGGTTIQGVRALERGGLRSAAMEAVTAAYEKAKSMQ